MRVVSVGKEIRGRFVDVYGESTRFMRDRTAGGWCDEFGLSQGCLTLATLEKHLGEVFKIPFFGALSCYLHEIQK